MVDPPKFSELEKPDLGPILSLHRRNDGYISFHRKNENGEHEDLFSVPAATIDNYFPSMSPLLERDAYFSINAFFRGGHGDARNSPPGIPLKRALRNQHSLRWLTACYADIDCHQLGITTGQAIGAIIDAQDKGRTPPASMLTRSGRGVWAFWFLVDAESSGPVRAWPEAVRLYCNIQNRLSKEFAEIGADANSLDPVRITRQPGSINSKSHTRVNYWLQGDKGGKRFTYGLDHLAERLNVQMPKLTDKLQADVADHRRQRAKGAWRGRWINARDNFERLWELRGSFSPGTRNSAVFLYVTFLRGLRLDQDAIHDEAGRLFLAMDQPAADPFTEDDLRAAIRGARGATNVSNQRISDLLEVTPEESEVLTAGRGWPHASRFGGPVPAELNRTELCRRRRNLLQAKVKSIASVSGRLEKWPGLEWLAAWLAEQGLECAFSTIKRDLEALGIPNPNAKRPRKTKTKSTGTELF